MEKKFTHKKTTDATAKKKFEKVKDVWFESWFLFLFLFYLFFDGLNTETGCIAIDCFTRPIGYHKERRDTPIQDNENLSIHECFKLCVLENQSYSVCKKRQFWVDYTSTFAVNQNISNGTHPFAFDADGSMGAAAKREFVRFYEVYINKNQGQLNISTEVSVQRK